MNYIAKTSIWTLATTRATRRTFTYALPETSLVTLGFDPDTAQGAEDVVRRHRAITPSNYYYYYYYYYYQ